MARIWIWQKLHVSSDLHHCRTTAQGNTKNTTILVCIYCLWCSICFCWKREENSSGNLELLSESYIMFYEVSLGAHTKINVGCITKSFVVLTPYYSLTHANENLLKIDDETFHHPWLMEHFSSYITCYSLWMKPFFKQLIYYSVLVFLLALFGAPWNTSNSTYKLSWSDILFGYISSWE